MQRDDRKYLTCPDLSVERVAGSEEDVQVQNRAFQTGCRASRDLLELLRFLKEPRTVEEVFERFGFPRDVFDILLAKRIVLAADEFDLLGPGIVGAARDSLGLSCTFGGLENTGGERSFVVFGAPVDLLGSPGAIAGPTEIRRSSLLRNVENIGPGENDPAALPADVEILDLDKRKRYWFGAHDRHAILDVGDVPYVRGEPITNVGERIGRLVGAVLERKMTPVMLGGDHAMTWFALKAFLDVYPKLGVLHFDAHPDLYAAPSVLSPLLSGNPFEHACQTTSLACLRQFGLRTMERVSTKIASRVHDPRISYFSAMELQRMSPQEALSGLDRDLPYYLSFDIDCVRPEEAPETGSPVCGGLSFYQAFELLNAIVDQFRLVGADFMEVASPKMRGPNMAAAITARLLDTLLLSRVSSSDLDTYYFRRKVWDEDSL